MLTLLSIGQFFKTNIKWVAIIFAACLIAFGAYKGYKLIESNGIYKAEIQKLQSDIKFKDITIQLYKDKIRITEEVVQERDDLITRLEVDLTDALTDLPEDNKDQAPESTKVFIQRLKEKAID